MGYTPGPWTVEYIEGEDYYGCPMYGAMIKCGNWHYNIELDFEGDKNTPSFEKFQANAQLIAAAPEWHELANDLWWFIENINNDDPTCTDIFFRLRERIRKLNDKTNWR